MNALLTPKSETRCLRRITPALGVTLLLMASSMTHAQAAQEAGVGDTDKTAQWREEIWRAACDGESERLEELFTDLPDDAEKGASLKIKESWTARSQHIADSDDDRDEARKTAAATLQEELDANDVTGALLAAVKMQSLSNDWSDVLEEPAVAKLIVKAEAELEAEEDLLLVQEILFTLRMLHDDKALRPLDYKRYDNQLEKVNRRIGLLARYAPRRLHELRKLAAERRDLEAEFPEFNEAFAEDWQEELRGITQPMLRASLRIAAGEHVARAGWKPLLDGGLEALDLFVSTEGLSENFPLLANSGRVQEWKDNLVRERKRLAETDSSAVDRQDYNRIMSSILSANISTISVPETVLLREFGEGATYRLEDQFEDQYTQIIWPQRLRRFQQQVQGEFVGVGILIRHDDKREIMVVNPLEGSPAARYGVEENDRVVSVNGVPTTGWSLTRAVDEITGPKNETVVLGVRREGVEDVIDIPIVRAVIKIYSVNGWWKEELQDDGTPSWDWYIDKDAGIGYVRLTSFNDDSFEDFLRAIEEMKAERDLRGLVLDLRHNPGGLLDSAVKFSNLFVEKGLIVSCQDGERNEVWRKPARARGAQCKDLPLVVLVNQGSASASEIVSGCLQSHDVAVVIGDRTFGKGSVQSLHDVSDRFGAAALKLTTQYYALPPGKGETNGRLVHKVPGASDWGVNPDLTVEMDFSQIDKAINLRKDSDLIADWDEDRDPESRPRPEALIQDGLDPQLEMALLLLQARLLESEESEQLVTSG